MINKSIGQSLNFIIYLFIYFIIDRAQLHYLIG